MRLPGRLQRRLPKGDFGRGVLTLVTGTVAAQAIAIGSAPVLTRLFTTSEFGAYSVAISIIAILITISSLSYPFAIPLPEDEIEAASALALSLALALVAALIATVLLWWQGQAIVTALGVPTVAPYVLLLPLAQFGGSFVAAMTYWAVRARHFSVIAATRLTQTGTLVVTQIVLGVAGGGVLGLLLGDVVGRFSGSIRLARAAWNTSAAAFRGVTGTSIRASATRYRRFAIFSTPSSIINTLGLQVPLLLIVALYGAETGGLYALAVRLCALPVSLISGAVGQVYFAEGSRISRERPDDLLALFWRTTRSLATTAAGPFLLLAVLAPVLAAPVFGPSWAEAGVFVALLAPMYFAALVTNPTGGTLDFLERQEVQLVLGIIRTGLVSGAVVAAYALALPPVGAVAVLSLAGTLTYASFGVAAWRAIVGRSPSSPPASAGGTHEHAN